MDQVRLGKSGLHVSRVCLGMMSYGSVADLSKTRQRDQWIRLAGSRPAVYRPASIDGHEREIRRSEALDRCGAGQREPRHPGRRVFDGPAGLGDERWDEREPSANVPLSTTLARDLWESMNVLGGIGTVEGFAAGGHYLLGDEAALSCGTEARMDGSYVPR